MDENRKRYPAKISLVMRMVVSVWLLYTVWELRGAPAAHTGSERIFVIAAMAIFTVSAVVLGGFSLKAFLREEYSHPEDSYDSHEEDRR